MAHRRPGPRLLGLLLVLVALALLVAGSGGEAPGLGAYLSPVPFVPGLLLLLGFLGRPAALPDAPPDVDRDPVVVPEEPREFRHATGRAGYAVVWFLAICALGAGGSLLALVPGATGAVGALIFAAAIMIATGGLLAFYARRRPRTRILVDADGIRSHGLVRTVSVPWAEVVELRALGVRSGSGYPIGHIHRVHGTRRTVSFSDSILDLPELLALVERATGLAWS